MQMAVRIHQTSAQRAGLLMYVNGGGGGGGGGGGAEASEAICNE